MGRIRKILAAIGLGFALGTNPQVQAQTTHQTEQVDQSIVDSLQAEIVTFTEAMQAQPQGTRQQSMRAINRLVQKLPTLRGSDALEEGVLRRTAPRIIELLPKISEAYGKQVTNEPPIENGEERAIWMNAYVVPFHKLQEELDKHTSILLSVQ